MECLQCAVANRGARLGAKDVDELKEKLKDTIKEQKLEFSKIDPLKELEDYEKKQMQKAQKSEKLRDPRSPEIPKAPYKTLNSFIVLEKLNPLSKVEIEYLWRVRFDKVDNSLIACIDSAVFDKLYKNARENPIFVLPIPRGEGDNAGFELHYIQWSFVGPNTVHCMFTTLLEFQTHGEFARPHTSLSFHTELKDSKGIVLMNGNVESDTAVTVQDAQLLLLNLQKFYANLNDNDISKRRLQLLRNFTSGKDFSVDELIKESQSLEM